MATRPLMILGIVLSGALAIKGLSFIDQVPRLISNSATAVTTLLQAEEKTNDEDDDTSDSENESNESGNNDQTEQDANAPDEEQEGVQRPRSSEAIGISRVSQFNLKTDLDRRSRVLDEREDLLNTREQFLEVAESRFDDRLLQLQEMKDEILRLLKELEQTRNNKNIALVETVSQLDAESAAGLFAGLRQEDPETLIILAQSLNSEEYRLKFALILGAAPADLRTWVVSKLRTEAEFSETLIGEQVRNAINANE